MTYVIPSGAYKNITATGNVSAVPATIIGVLCATTTAGTFQVYDSSTTTTTTPITGVVTPAAGSFTPIYAAATAGLYIVVGGTINATVIYA
jgi:hypothetical protein